MSIHTQRKSVIIDNVTWHIHTRIIIFVHALWKWDRALQVDANNCGQHNKLGVSVNIVRIECKEEGKKEEKKTWNPLFWWVSDALSVWVCSVFFFYLVLCVRSSQDRNPRWFNGAHLHTNILRSILYRHGSVQFSLSLSILCQNVKLLIRVQYMYLWCLYLCMSILYNKNISFLFWGEKTRWYRCHCVGTKSFFWKKPTISLFIRPENWFLVAENLIFVLSRAYDMHYI